MAGTGKSRLAADALARLRNKGRLKGIPSTADGGMAEVLLLAIIARGAPVAAARRALDRMKASVVSWNELRVTQPAEVAAMLGGIRDAQSKATAIHEALTNIFEGTHDLELKFLEGATAEEARDFLRGLGALTDDIVDMMILAGRGHFTTTPNTGVVRVVRRLGLCGRAGSAAKCEKALEALLGGEKAYQLMFLMKELAETTCTPHSPKCAECALVIKCPSARRSRAR